ncbi:MAG: hypothetical protein NTW87_03055 [Planctomycetota bacterium]|nr:hypothetical protein [Planctomycetota bacterium]
MAVGARATGLSVSRGAVVAPPLLGVTSGAGSGVVLAGGGAGAFVSLLEVLLTAKATTTTKATAATLTLTYKLAFDAACGVPRPLGFPGEALSAGALSKDAVAMAALVTGRCRTPDVGGFFAGRTVTVAFVCIAGAQSLQ